MEKTTSIFILSIILGIIIFIPIWFMPKGISYFWAIFFFALWKTFYIKFK